MLADSFLAAWVGSVLLHAAAAGFLTGYGWAGFALASAGLTIVAARAKAAGVVSQRTVHQLRIGALMVALGAGFFALQPRRSGFSGPDAPNDTGGLGSGKYRGVVLWTDPKHQAMVIPPRPAQGKGRSQREQDWSIPFDGVYWFFKFPDQRPPTGSYTLTGSPAKTVFRSSDNFVLEMEARQNFVNPIEMSCCSRIAVEINNADAFPGTVFLALTLSNLRLPGEPSESLGRLPVTGTAHESLNFAMPGNPRISQFDAATVKFLRTGRQNLRSAEITIEQFNLTPRGR